jgi:hypothetical protein
MNYLNPKVEVRNTPDKGRGLFAKEKILKGETIEKTTEGIQILTKAEIAIKPDAKLWKSLCYEVGGDKEECPIDVYNPPASFLINHSCDPNVGVGNDMIAMRDIGEDEELTYDYAMTDSGDYDMECRCGSINCRERIKGTDWTIPELQEKYKGYFAKNIQEKIDKIKQ